MCTSWCFGLGPLLSLWVSTCLDGLGVTSPGAKPRDPEARHRYRPVCGCIGHLDPTTRQWLDVNCGQKVSHHGVVRKWHKPPPGYDHEEATRAGREQARVKRQAAIAARPPLAHDLSADLENDDGELMNYLENVALSLTELEIEEARILRENWDVIDPLRKIPNYFGVTVKDEPIEVFFEPGRFLHNFNHFHGAGKSYCCPMLQFAEQNALGTTIFSRDETRVMGFETRLVYESYEMFQACQVEEHMQSKCIDIMPSICTNHD